MIGYRTGLYWRKPSVGLREQVLWACWVELDKSKYGANMEAMDVLNDGCIRIYLVTKVRMSGMAGSHNSFVPFHTLVNWMG
jgi:hypothetical protein